MKNIRKHRLFKPTIWTVIFVFLSEFITPSVSWALTSGPASPEFSSFEPAVTTNLVNPFTGSFTYNLPVVKIPGPEGGGYSMSLSYHSGTSPEEEASWVGYGWTLNPGSIIRNKKGNPDDYKGDVVRHWNKVDANWTVAATGSAGNIEVFSKGIDIGFSGTLRYNNYKGFGTSVGADLSVAGGLSSLGYSLDDGSGSFSFSVNPAALLNKKKYENNFEDKEAKSEASQSQAKGEKKAFKDQLKAWAKQTGKNIKTAYRNKWSTSLAKSATAYGLYALSDHQKPSSVSSYRGNSVNFSAEFEVDPGFIPAGVTVGVSGKYSIQVPDPKKELKAYGYLYQSQASNNPDAQLDYSIEKEMPFHKRDQYLSIPHTGADNYSVTGEGISGGFRLRSNRAGHYGPNEVESKTDIGQAGVEIHTITDLGGGADVGVGRHNLRVKNEWTESGNTGNYSFKNEDDEDLYYRFTNDLGGSAAFGENFGAQTASLKQEKWVPGLKDFSPEIPSSIPQKVTTKDPDEDRVGRSSYIAYNTHKTLNETFDNKRFRSFTTNEIALDINDHSTIEDGVAEFSVVNQGGMRYNYGLPVYSRSEKNMQYGLLGLAASDIKNNYQAFKSVSGPTSASVAVGEERDAPYATMYLLTEILSPNYVDLTNDGLSPDDFGGYTRFDYRRVYGSDNKKDYADTNWYKWRIPYNGLSYNRNELSNPRDDMGAVAMGEKEMYYLKTVETKTHVAVFVTNKSNFTLGGLTFSGSQLNREDGMDADHNEGTASASATAKGSKRPEYLERIEVYVKDKYGNPAQLLQTTHFSYSNTLVKGLPNGESASTGKLTLDKVWFEYNGVKNARISPYKFSYVYPKSTDYESEIQSRYPLITAYGDALSSTEQNPDYSPFNLDAWGNYQYDGANRYNELRTWLDQDPDLSTFDPAAWQLKKITMPSGGEIHVQYEAHDYRFVQDRAAMAMVSLKDESTDGDSPSDTKYYLNLDDLGIETTNQTAINALAQKIRDEIQDKGDKIYFKFLYALVGNTANKDKCNSDYINGYTDIKEVGVETGKLFLRLGNDDENYSVPRKICIDFVKSERGGMLDPSGGCNASIDGMKASQNPNMKELINALMAKVNTEFASNSTNCLDMDDSHSYLRIPLVQAKKGGGVRVKRIMMYDKGMEEGDANLFGTEYTYEEYDEQLSAFASSGVATNEPYNIREENALVGFLEKRKKQKWYQRAFSGRDKEQFEGPIGEYILPAPSIGYSTVVARNIHQGKTNAGFSVNQYYTVRDYPFDHRYEQLTDDSGNHPKGVEFTEIEDKSDWLVVPAVFAKYSVTNLWRTQGYQFILNNRHGQPRIAGTYSGVYNDPDKWIPTATTEHFYYEPGEKVPMLYDQDDIRLERPGYESDVFFEMRRTEDVSKDGHLEIDVSMATLPIPLPFGSAFPTVSYKESKLHSHVTVKVLSFPSVEKGTISFADGVYHKTDHLAHDRYTGRPMKTRTYDGYDQLNLASSNDHKGWYTAYSFPAHQAYDQFNQKAMKEGKFIRSDNDLEIDLDAVGSVHYLNFTAAAGKSVCGGMNALSAGDEVMVYDGSTPIGIFHIGEALENKLTLYRNHHYQHVLGSYPSVDVEILRSSRNNQLESNVGSLMAYGEGGEPYVDALSTDILNKREAWVNRLNQAIAGKNGQGRFIDVVSNSSDSVKIMDPISNSCDYYANNLFFDFDLNESTGRIYFLDFDNLDTARNLVRNGNLYRINTTSDNIRPFKEFAGSLPHFPWEEYSISPQQNYHNDINSGYVKMWTMYKHGVYNSEGIWQTVQNLQTNNDYMVSYYYRSLYSDTIADSLSFYLSSSPQIGTDPLDASHVSDPQFYSKSQKISQIVQVDETDWTHVSKLFTCDDANQDRLLIYPTIVSPVGWQGWVHVGAVSIYEKSYLDSQIVCSTTLPISGGAFGEFKLNRRTGEVEYFTADNECYPNAVPCIDFCPNVNDLWKMNGVVSANAVELNDSWNYTIEQEWETWGDLYLTFLNPYISGHSGQWRQKSRYQYRDSIVGGADDVTGERIYADAGTISGYTFFDWKYPQNNDAERWLKQLTVTRYTPLGKPSEEVDRMGMHSTALYGYNQHLPIMAATNAEYDEVLYESYENVYLGANNKYYLEAFERTDTTYLDSGFAHSGSVSMLMPISSIGLKVGEIQFTSHVKSAGLTVKLWASSPGGWLSCTGLRLNIGGGVFKNFTKVSRVGEWTLYECQLTSADLTPIFTDGTNDLTIEPQTSCQFFPFEAAINIDDVKAHPADAQVNCFVYDPLNFNILTAFDNQHFGVFYQYNGEGKIIRKKLETDRGMRTVQESRYHVPSEARN